jgi:hypothetical protein
VRFLIDNALSPIVAERLRSETAPSLILLRQAGKRGPEHQAALLRANLAGMEEPLRTGCVIVLEDARIRIRRLPIGGP